MKLWQHPSNYIGATWEGWLVFLGQHRDSDCLARSNFRCGLAALKAIASKDPVPGEDCATVQVVRESHWAVGWVEWIAVHPSDTEAVKLADEMLDRLENYPVLDEEDYSQLEQEEAESIWRDCYNTKERVEYIRKHRSQFEARSLSDLLGCVRGKYFLGYPSELLN